MAGVDTGGFNATRFVAGQLDITGNQVTTANSTNLIVSTSGNASADINSILIEGDTIANPTSTALTLASTGTGYYKFNSKLAIVVPISGDANPPPTPEIGDLRYNPDAQQLQVYDNGQYNSTAGVGNLATRDDVAEITDLWTLILG